MRVLITGSRGFIGMNVAVVLGQLEGNEIIRFDREDALPLLYEKVAFADAVIHLAGVNRSEDRIEFKRGNEVLTREVCKAIQKSGRLLPLILASSTQAELSNPYGLSKLAAEREVEELASRTGNPVVIYRLPNVFGKWCRPNYNSVVATYCYNIANDLPIRIDDPGAQLRLVHVDDVVSEFLVALAAPTGGVRRGVVKPQYLMTLKDLAAQIEAFRNCRSSLVSERVGTGLVRALYSTFVSYLPTTKFAYDVPSHADKRGVFVEMLKTVDSGQFSYFTAYPGATRGGHFHHTKTEKFLVIKGSARFRFRHIISGQLHEVSVCGEHPRIVETIPGWTHDITNIGDDELVVMLWANEIFDRERPDTYAKPI